MKRFLQPAYLPFIALSGGGITLLLRLWLLLSEDDRGLLPVGNFPDVLSWIMVAIMIVVFALGSFELKEGKKYSYNFPPSDVAGIGTLLAGIGFFVTSIQELSFGSDRITLVSSILGFFSAGALVFLAYCRTKGRRPSVIFQGIICLYLITHLVSYYRLWSAAPQLQSYGFELLAIVFLMLACYQRAAFDAGCGNRRSYAFFSLTAILFSIACLPGCRNWIFYLGGAIWMCATFCKLTTPQPLQR